MTARFHCSRPRPERLSCYPGAPRIYRTANAEPPSKRLGVSWRALPVEGSKAWRDSQPSAFRRIFFTR